MKKRMTALFAAAVLILACFAGCSSNSSASAKDAYYDGGASYAYASSSSASSGAYAPEEAEAEYWTEAEMPEPSPTISDDGLLATGNIDASRKIIRNADVYIETTEFSASVDKLQSLVTEMGGYISNADVSVYNSTYQLHRAYYTIRIPAAKFDSFIERREDVGSVNSTNVWTDDVTDSYYDMQARLDTLETKRARLLELLEKAENMEDIIALESELSDTVYEIESMTGSLRRLDDRISYSTININLQEVRETSEPVVLPKTLGERISQQFTRTIDGLREFFEDFIVWFIGALPVFIVLAVLILVFVLIWRRRAPKRAEKRVKKAQEAAARQAEAVARWQAAQAVPAAQSAKPETEKKD